MEIFIVRHAHAVDATEDPARHVGERIPDGRLAAIGLRRAFDLEGGRRDAEGEIAGETVCEGFGIGHIGLPVSSARRFQSGPIVGTFAATLQYCREAECQLPNSTHPPPRKAS